MDRASDSTNGSYFAALNGLACRPPLSCMSTKSIDWSIAAVPGPIRADRLELDERWDVLAGARVNETAEQKSSVHVDGFDPVANATGADQKRELRLSGTLGISRTIAVDQGDRHVLFADRARRRSSHPHRLRAGLHASGSEPETARQCRSGHQGHTWTAAKLHTH